MNWITGIQRAIDYVEEHLTEPVDYEEVAERALSSSFHFQRVFAILCGFTLGEYIRWRRLSLAGSELIGTGRRVLDIALKYGYDTPESFARAFTRFHGVTPSQAKAGGAVLKTFSPLSAKLILDGGTTMDYRIVKQGPFQMIAKKKRVPRGEETTAAEISAFWRQCGTDGTIPALCRYTDQKSLFGQRLLGASFGEDAADRDFPYGIGGVYNGAPIAEADFTLEDIPAHTYVVFPCTGAMPDAFQALYRRIYSEFFPASEYQPCGGPDFEAYPSDQVDSPDYCCEIWVAVEKK